MSSIRSVVIGSGAYLPQNCVSNEELAKTVDTSDEWIRKRTGITQRYIAAPGEMTSDLATNAARAALENANLSIDDIDMIILATTTPDDTFPATATKVQKNLGMTHGFAFDLQAVCSGFVYAMATADSYLKNALAKRALVIGAETFTRILDWNDRGTCVLFGDGAGALILEAQPGNDAPDSSGILASCLRSDGRHREKLYVDGGVSSTQRAGVVKMQGNEVFRHAVGMISDVVLGALEIADMTTRDLDWFVPHQANIRILDAVGRKLDIPSEKVIVTVDKHANTSAASVPLALCTALADGRINKGDLVMLEAVGGGFTWGANLIRW